MLATTGGAEGSGDRVTKLLGFKNLQERTGVSQHTWRRWARQGRVPVVRLGRRVLVREDDLDAMLKQAIRTP